MRNSRSIAAIFAIALFFPATALPCSTHCDRDSLGSRGKAATEWNDVVTSRVGDTTVWSNGYTSKNVGNHRSIFSDGSMATRHGNMSVFDNGRTCTHYGNSVVCEEPRASSRRGRGW
jgi:hypothetical protein